MSPLARFSLVRFRIVTLTHHYNRPTGTRVAGGRGEAVRRAAVEGREPREKLIALTTVSDRFIAFVSFSIVHVPLPSLAI